MFEILLCFFGCFILFCVCGIILCVLGNACSPSPCLNGGYCSSSGSSYQCTCLTGYTGSQCQTQQSEYQQFNKLFFLSDSYSACSVNFCLYGATCDALSDTSFQCICKEGTSGSLCGNLGNIRSRLVVKFFLMSTSMSTRVRVRV